MKKLYTTILAACLLSTVFAQDVPQVQQSLITKVSATWCGNCGTWGWAFYDDLIIDNDDKALMVVAHHSGDLTTSEGSQWADNFNASSQPKFILNNTDQFASSGNTAALRTSIKDAVDAAYAESPLANAGIEVVTADNSTFQINTKTKFFDAASGEYYLGIYIVEEGVIANQSGQGANTSHHDILRGSVNGVFGEMVLNGAATAGQEFIHNYEYTPDPGWNHENFEYVAIIWEKVGDTYLFVNGHSTTDVTPTVSTTNLAEEIALGIQPNPSVGDAFINMILPQAEEDARIRITDLNGGVVRETLLGALPAGQHGFPLERGSLPTGMYLVSVVTAEGVATRKWMLR